MLTCDHAALASSGIVGSPTTYNFAAAWLDAVNFSNGIATHTQHLVCQSHWALDLLHATSAYSLVYCVKLHMLLQFVVHD